MKKQLIAIQSHFNVIAAAVGKQKEPLVQACWNHPVAGRALYQLLNPMAVFHIRERSFRNADLMDIPPSHIYKDIFDICYDLQTKSALTNQDIVNVTASLKAMQDPALEEYAKKFLCKAIKLGITASTVNKVLGREAIPVFQCMLANKYFDHLDYLDGKAFAVTEKLDGIRCIAVARRGAAPVLYTRQGQEIDGLLEIENELWNMADDLNEDFVLDGELIVCDREKYASKDQYKRTTMIVRRDGVKSGVILHAFDYLSLNALERRSCDTPYYQRRQKLDAMLMNGKYIKAVPVLYVGKDQAKIMDLLQQQRQNHREGVMVNVLDAFYQFRRTSDILKVKVMNDCDLKIIGFQEGDGKFKGMLGAFIVDYKGNPVGVGTGISDEVRKAVWQNRDAYLGRVIKVSFFEETQNKDGVLSIRFPSFHSFCEEGKEVSYA